MFEKFTENALAYIPYTAATVDMLISGITDMDHLENIEKVCRGG